MRDFSKFVLAVVALLPLLQACSDKTTLTNAPASARLAPAQLQTVSMDTIFMPFDRDAVYSRELYVAASAITNGDGSQISPFNNIADAIYAARPGTRIHITAGTYPALGLFANVQGTSTAPITLIGDGKAIIDAAGKGSGVTFRDARYLVLDGLTIQNTGVHGMNIDDGGSNDTPSAHVVLRNMHFRNIGSGNNNDCLKLSGVEHFYIANSEFEGCNEGEAIDMVGCHHGIITGSYFHDVVINGVQTKGGSSDILIHGNLFADIPQRAVNLGGHTGEPYFRPINSDYEAERIRVIANLFLRTGTAAVAFIGCHSCVAANNTIIEPHNYIVWIVEENKTRGPGRNGYFINNLILFNQAQLNHYSVFNTNQSSPTDTFVIDANLWYALDNTDFNQLPNGSKLALGTHSLHQLEPKLDKSYRLTKVSPLTGKGLAVPGGLPADYTGRKFAQPPAIGAFAAP